MNVLRATLIALAKAQDLNTVAMKRGMRITEVTKEFLVGQRPVVLPAAKIV